MYRTLIFCVILYLFFVITKAQKYTTKYDNINVDEILRNERLLNAYTKCLLDQGRCTNDGAELRQIIPDALTTNCMSCSSNQRTAAMRVIAYLTANKPNIWKNLLTKYDPQGLYSKRLRQQG